MTFKGAIPQWKYGAIARRGELLAKAAGRFLRITFAEPSNASGEP